MESATVGILKTMLTMDTSSYEAGSRKGASSSEALKKSISGVTDEVQKLTPLAERMVRGFGGEKLLHTANSLTAAVTKLGGAQKLTDAEQARVNKTLNDAIAKYQKLGQEAPKAMIEIEKATRRVDAANNKMAAGMAAMGEIGRKAYEKLQASERMIAGMGASGRGQQQQGGGGFLSSFATSLGLGGTAFSAGFGAAAGGFLGAAAASGVREVGAAISDVLVKGSQLVNVERGFNQLTASVNESAAAMLAASRGAVKGLVSDLDLMLAANKAILLGLPVTSQEMATLARTAVTLGKAMGLDATQSLNDLIVALGRSSPLILDNLGLTVKVGEANEKYAATLGKTVNDLTEAEQKQAFYNAAMEAARKKTDALGDSSLTLTEEFGRLSTATGNIITKWGAGENGASALSRVIGFLADEATRAAESIDLVEQARQRLGEKRFTGTRDLLPTFREQQEVDKILQETLDDITRKLNAGLKASPGMGALSGQFDPSKTGDSLVRQTDALAQKLRQASDAAKQLHDHWFSTDQQQRALDAVRTIGAAGNVSKLTADKQRELTQVLEDGIVAWKAMGQAVPAAVTQMLSAVRALGTSRMTILGDLTATESAEDLIAKMRRDLEAITHLSPLDIVGDLFPQAESAEALIAQMTRDLEEFEAPGRRAGEIMRDIFAPLFGGVTGGVSDLIFGRFSRDIREAKREYESLKRSGTASAEELTRAFRRVRDAQQGMWDSFTRGVMDTLKNLLNYFVNGFLQGMLRSIAGTAFGKSVSGFLSSALGLGGGGLLGLGAGAGAGAAAAAATAAGTSAMALSPGFVASLGATGATAGAAGGAGMGAAIAGLATNPFTIAAAGVLGLFASGILTGGNMDPRKSFGGGPWRALHPPSVSMPSRTAISSGEGGRSTSFADRSGGGERTVVFHINSFDPRSVREIVTSPEVTDSIAHAFEQNKGLLTSRVGRALRP